jgi:hypothetical protein
MARVPWADDGHRVQQQSLEYSLRKRAVGAAVQLDGARENRMGGCGDHVALVHLHVAGVRDGVGCNSIADKPVRGSL